MAARLCSGLAGNRRRLAARRADGGSVETAPRNGEQEEVLAFTHLPHIYSQGSSIYKHLCLPRLCRNLARWEKFKHATSEATVRMGGTISRQQGIGSDHAPYLPAGKGKLGMSTLRVLCSHFDPERRLNPGKLLLDDE